MTREERLAERFEGYKIELKEKHPHVEMLDDNYHGSAFKMKFRCKEHNYEFNSFIDVLIRSDYGCFKCFNERMSGDSSPNWDGGSTNIRNYLRQGSIKWRDKILLDTPYCDISGVKFNLEVHHIYPTFKDIFEKTMNNTGIDIRANVSDYSPDELRTLLLECESLHVGARGVVLTKAIHRKFHSLYGHPQGFQSMYDYFVDYKVKMWMGNVSEVGEEEIDLHKTRDNFRVKNLSWINPLMINESESEGDEIDSLLRAVGIDGRSSDAKILNFIKQESIMDVLKHRNNFFGKIGGYTASDFYKCLDSGLRNYEDRLESVNSLFYVDGVLHPYWSQVFEQESSDATPNINLLVRKNDSIYSESNVATVLNAVGTYLLEPYICGYEDSEEPCEIKTDYELYKDELLCVSLSVLEEMEEQDYYPNVYEIKDILKDCGHNASYIKEPPKARYINDYHNDISNEIVLNTNRIRHFSKLETWRIAELDSIYRYNLEYWYGEEPPCDMWKGIF